MDREGAAAVDDDDDGPGRSPLVDPRLAGAGGMLIATAALAWLLTHATHHEPATPPRTGSSATASAVPGGGSLPR